MKAKELKALLMTAIEVGIKESFLRDQQAVGLLLLGGVVMSTATRFKVRVVDKDYHPHTYTIIIEEGAP